MDLLGAALEGVGAKLQGEERQSSYMPSRVSNTGPSIIITIYV